MTAQEDSNESTKNSLSDWYSQHYQQSAAAAALSEGVSSEDWIQCTIRSGETNSNSLTLNHLCWIDARHSNNYAYSETDTLLMHSLRGLLTTNNTETPQTKKTVAYDVELVLDFNRQAQLIYPVLLDEEDNPRPPTPEGERQAEVRRLWYHRWTQDFLSIFLSHKQNSDFSKDHSEENCSKHHHVSCLIRSLEVRELPSAEFEKLHQHEQSTYTSLVAKLLQNSPSSLRHLTIQQTYLHVDWEAIARAIAQLEDLQSFTFVSPSFAPTMMTHNTGQDSGHNHLAHVSNPVETIVVGVLEAVLEVSSLRSCTFGRPSLNSQDIVIPSKVPFTRGALASVVQHPGLAYLAFSHCVLSEDQVLDGLVQGFREEFGGPEFFITPEGYEDVSDHALFALHKHAQGLQTLSFKGTVLSDTSLAALAHALSTHPTLTVWNLEETTGGRKGDFKSLEDYDRFHARKTARTDYILEMLHWNISLEEIQFTLSERDESIYEKIQFFLDSNRRGLRRLKAGVPRSVWGQAIVRLTSPGEISYLFLMLRMRPDLVMEVDSSSSFIHCKDDGPKKPLAAPLSSLSRWGSMLGAKAKGLTRSSVKATKGLTKSLVRSNAHSNKSTTHGSSSPRKGRVPSKSKTSPRHSHANPTSSNSTATVSSVSRRRKHTTQRKVTGTLLEC